MKLAAVLLLAAVYRRRQRPRPSGDDYRNYRRNQGWRGTNLRTQLIPEDSSRRPLCVDLYLDDEKGKQPSPSISGDTITQSEIQNTALSSPGTNAVLQIGSAVWEFGASTRSQVTLRTSASGKSEQFVYTTQAGSNRVSSQIVPAKGGYWPKNGDWRSVSSPLARRRHCFLFRG